MSVSVILHTSHKAIQSFAMLGSHIYRLIFPALSLNLLFSNILQMLGNALQSLSHQRALGLINNNSFLINFMSNPLQAHIITYI
jgi:hypothetical protein